MSADKFIKIGKIIDGQYNVSIDLNGLLNPEEIDKFKSDLNNLRKSCCGDRENIYIFEGDNFKYRSETIFPSEERVKKRKILIVFGNPAFDSVTNGMFFFSKAGYQRHGMWGKLEKSGLMKRVDHSNENPFLAREREAGERKRLIVDGRASEDYCLGLTTFYSFPTPVEGPFRDVQGVEKLFKPILKSVIIPFEVNRILHYPFSEDAILVFVQKSSRKAFAEFSKKSSIYWPVRGKNSSGACLGELLQSTE